MKKEHKHLTRISAVLLAVFFLFTSQPVSVRHFYRPPEDVHFEEMQYVRPDIDAYVRDLKALREMSALDIADTEIVDRCADAVLRYYDICTMEVLSMLQHQIDLTSEAWQEENRISSAAASRAYDELHYTISYLLDSAYDEALTDYFGYWFAESLRGYEKSDESYFELMEDETDMIMSFEQLYSEFESTIGTPEEQAALQSLAEEYVGMLTLRRQLAEEYDYDNFADFANDYLFYRDYSLSSVEESFFVDVQQHFAPLLDSIGYEYYDKYADLINQYELPPADKLIEKIGRNIGKVAPQMERAWRYMVDNGLYDIEESSTKMAGAFVIGLPAYDSAFLYSSPSGYFGDYQALLHEFGHFSNSYFDNTEYLFSYTSADVAEIHSQTMELFYLPYFEADNSELTKAITCWVLYDLIGAIIYSTYLCEFEAAAYKLENPTVEQLTELACSIGIKYFPNAEPESLEYYWITVPHLYSQPMYVLSYSVSAMAALQIWVDSYIDYDAAFAGYLSLLTAPSYGYGYCAMAEDYGLVDIFSSDALALLSKNIDLIFLQESSPEKSPASSATTDNRAAGEPTNGESQKEIQSMPAALLRALFDAASEYPILRYAGITIFMVIIIGGPACIGAHFEKKKREKKRREERARRDW